MASGNKAHQPNKPQAENQGPKACAMPYSGDSERAILGSILLDNVGLDFVLDAGLYQEDFYSSAHRLTFQRMCDLLETGKVVNLVTLSDELAKDGMLEKAGGAAYLAALSDGVPIGTTAGLGEYVKIVKEKARLRRTIAICETGALKAFELQDSTEIINSVQQQFFDLVSATQKGGFVSASEILRAELSDIEKRFSDGNRGLGIQTRFKDLDAQIGGLAPGELTIIAARPSVGKTALALNIAANVAIRGEASVGIFSLEMNKESLLLRVLCSEARVDSWRLKTGFASREDWGRIAAAAGIVGGSKFYIDESSSISISELRARTRMAMREKQFELVIVDYLQLVTGTGENRTQEVGSISRGLKALAKDLKVPVIALSQLSRGVEDKSNPRPQLSDLRESGCLSKNTTLLLTPQGVQTNMPSHMSVYSLNKSKFIGPTNSKDIPQAEKPVFRFLLTSGRYVDCTANHKILTDRGWVRAADITKERAVACVRKVSPCRHGIAIRHARWMGWMLGNGSMCGYSSPSFICSDIDLAERFCCATESLFHRKPRPHPHKSQWVWQYDITYGPVRTPGGNPCKDWLKAHEMWDRTAQFKRIPDWFMEDASNDSISEILGGLYDTDGSVYTVKDGYPHVKYSSTSREMAWQVVLSLNRLGIFARIDDGYFSTKATTDCYAVLISEGREIEKFRRMISLTGEKGRKLLALELTAHGSNQGDRLPLWVGKAIDEERRRVGLTYEKLGYRFQKKRISKDDLDKCLNKLPRLRKQLGWMLNENIFWDRLKSFEPIGTVEVFDRQVEGEPNFVANGIIVHNSIEQDADIVAFLYRSKKESFENQINVWIGKNRNGPVGEIPLVFLPKWVRFETPIDEAMQASFTDARAMAAGDSTD